MKNRIMTAGQNFPVQPEHINAAKHFWEAFGHRETEVSARWIVRFLQERKQGWIPFTYEDINAFYTRELKGSFSFNRLVNVQMVPPSLARAFVGHDDPHIPVGGGWIVRGDDDKYYITVEFVTRCFKSQPMTA